MGHALTYRWHGWQIANCMYINIKSYINTFDFVDGSPAQQALVRCALNPSINRLSESANA